MGANIDSCSIECKPDSHLAFICGTLRQMSESFRTFRTGIAIVIGFAFLCGPSCLIAASLDLRLIDGKIFVSSNSEMDSTRLYLIYKSSDLKQWVESARSFRPPHHLLLPAELPQTYLRHIIKTRSSSDDWASLLSPDDQHLFTANSSSGRISFVKFSFFINNPSYIYFQDTRTYSFHLDFARKRMPGLEQISAQEFSRISLYNRNQSIVLGSILRSPDQSIPELAVQFSAAEALDVSHLAHWILEVKNSLILPSNWKFFYMPSFEQLENVLANRALFDDLGISIDSPTRWLQKNTCYSEGWALGRLVNIPGHQIASAYARGELKPTDIILTDGIPAEVPPVAGIITSTPATPNSHVALLAQASKIPLVWLENQSQTNAIESLVGREIFLLIQEDDAGNCQISFLDITDTYSQEQKTQILNTRIPPPLEIQKFELAGTYFLPTISLKPADIRYVGGKSANFASLTRTLPENSPTPSMALTFDLWDEFLSQPFRNSNQSIREAISTKLQNFSYPPDIPALHKALYDVRKWIEQGSFSQQQKQNIFSELSLFEYGEKIRFRSSTNVEDSDSYSGAGLYDSYSGCLADDLDPDNDGPSHCDPNENNERGVLRAIKKVFASFYNDHAFLERLKYNIHENDVGMAVLIHPSSPDRLELANGVADLTVSVTPDNQLQSKLRLVSQVGPNSITNPTDSHLPEIVIHDKNTWSIDQRSTLTEPNQQVLTFPDEYMELHNLMLKAAQDYILQRQMSAPQNSPITHVHLDLEFKKLTPDHLQIRQIRAIPTTFTPPIPDIIP